MRCVQVLFLTSVVVFVLVLWRSSFLQSAFLHSEPAPRPNRPLMKESCAKWIVVTSIQYPTEAVKRLAAVPGWRVVVVGDKKTPHNWSYPNVTFLGVEVQHRLGYRITSLLPYGHYARKNIGYLYAIQHGAKMIYETDDDNMLISQLFEPGPLHSAYLYPPGLSVLNPYSHFGQPTVWPRGYPLDNISDSDSSHNRLREISLDAIGIFQGLANGDPDVDAIFRLTRKTKSSALDVSFESTAPLAVLPRGTMAPFNSQNTLFRYAALWGTLIPLTTTFRVCDIWRGFWSQRLLWEAGLSLAFTSPTVYQKRNAHTYMDDYMQERDLYEKSGKLVQDLLLWKPVSGSFQSMVMSLTKYMAVRGYWGMREVTLVRAWIEDLQDLGYEFPLVQQADPSGRHVIYRAKIGSPAPTLGCWSVCPQPNALHAEEFEVAPPVVEGPQYSSHKCIADHGQRDANLEYFWAFPKGGPVDRMCMFRNVCIRVPPLTVDNSLFHNGSALAEAEFGRLLYYRPSNKTSWLPIGLFDKSQVHREFPPGYDLILAPWDWPNYPRISVLDTLDSLPTQDQATWISHRVGIMGDLWTFSLGHLLGDYMLNFFKLQQELGLNVTFDFQMISMWPLMHTYRGRSLERSFGPFFAKHPMRFVGDLIPRQEQSKLVCFREAVAGLGDTLAFSHKLAFVLSPFRKWIMTHAGLNPDAVPSRHLVLMFNKSTEGTQGRGIINHREVEAAMRRRFGDAFLFTDFVSLPPLDQIDVTSRATVFITPGSGGSFIAMFLPVGAVRIELGVRGLRANESARFGYEVNLWSQWSAIHDWHYPVSPEEQPIGPTQSWFTAHYQVNAERLVEIAVLGTRKAEETHPHLRGTLP